MRSASVSLAIFTALAAFYILPGLIAVCRGRRHQWAVMMISLLFGWTGIGWVAALVWACSPEKIRRRAGRKIGGSGVDFVDFSNDNVGRGVAGSAVEWPEVAADHYADWLGTGEGLTEKDADPHLPVPDIKIAA